MRRYDDPVEVRSGWVEGPAHRGEGPEQFLWRGRLWKVRAVLARWVETGAWWQSSGVRAVIGSDDPAPGRGGRGGRGGAATAERVGPATGSAAGSTTGLLVERELWRVEAGRGADSAGSDSGGWGVFDLSFDWTEGSWRLVGCAD